jgi:hypothetical protein
MSADVEFCLQILYIKGLMDRGITRVQIGGSLESVDKDGASLKNAIR